MRSAVAWCPRSAAVQWPDLRAIGLRRPSANRTGSATGTGGMTKREQLVGSDRFEDLASAYKTVLVSLLDDALRECGIKPKRKRRQVCQRFLYRHSLLHDQSWLRTGGSVVYPLLGFAEHF